MKKILVIEDEPEMRRNLLTILRLEKFTALGAVNGKDGLDAARREKPELIICDVMMPGMNGHEVLQALRGDPSTATIPFIFLTSRQARADQRQGMSLGADDYLTKPFSREELLAAIAGVLIKRAPLEERLRLARVAELLVFTRWVLVMNAFERALYADPDADPGERHEEEGEARRERAERHRGREHQRSRDEEASLPDPRREAAHEPPLRRRHHEADEGEDLVGAGLVEAVPVLEEPGEDGLEVGEPEHEEEEEDEEPADAARPRVVGELAQLRVRPRLPEAL